MSLLYEYNYEEPAINESIENNVNTIQFNYSNESYKKKYFSSINLYIMSLLDEVKDTVSSNASEITLAGLVNAGISYWMGDTLEYSIKHGLTMSLSQWSGLFVGDYVYKNDYLSSDDNENMTKLVIKYLVCAGMYSGLTNEVFKDDLTYTEAVKESLISSIGASVIAPYVDSYVNSTSGISNNSY